MLKRLGEALASWSPRGEEEGGDPLARVSAAWPQVVGAEVARNSQPVRIAGDALVVATRSSAWSEQLSFLSERILASLRERFGLKEVRRLRFRGGRFVRPAAARVIRGSVGSGTRRRVRARDATSSPEEAIARFRVDVTRARRAKEDAGWKQCGRCASLVPPGERATCAACAIAAAQERERLVTRLLFEVPWLGYAGIAALVDGLGRDEYETIRARLLARWWETLARAARAKRLSRDRRERLVASSYVIVKSGLEPERIAPETMHAVLGDEIFALLYEVRE
ncbi:MAG TPA: DUF721 domain-containing protein [Candidatus Dormibacteraeota bacterium]|nr:DUF721 domain-containing protein [Candidatus Dormibacteraeota bacterium]